jgi:hypothetical protein
MVEKSEKFLGLDEFKEKVYKNIGTLEAFDELETGKHFETANKGCSGIFFTPLIMKISLYAKRETNKHYKIKELNKKADEILAQKEIKGLLCGKLDATIVLPIDAAYKLTPVLYGLALEDEEKVPFDSMLFAIICRKITKQGVENYCDKVEPKAEKVKDGKATAKKPSGD